MVLFFKDIVKGMWRRKREFLLIIVVQFFAVLFVMATLLLQHNASNYTLEANRYVYGDWTLAEVVTNAEKRGQQLKNHPYFGGYGTAVSGPAVVDVEGKEYAYSMGWLDETLLEIGHVKLREGRFPENEHEIVMEIGLLSELGYSLELGQQITLFLYEDEFQNGRLETFELVGVLEGSLSYWDVGSYMPGALVTREVLDTIWFQPQTIYCYYLDERYEEADTVELARNLSKKYEAPSMMGWSLHYNKNLYAASFWDGTQLYESVEQMVLVIGMAAMAFLLAEYIQKRKKYYYDLRTIGMPKLRIKLVIFWELLCACGPGVLLGIPGGLLLGAVACTGIARAENLENFYEVPLQLVGKAFLMWLVIFVASSLIAMLMTGDQRLYSGSKIVSLRFQPRWSLNKLRQNRLYSSIFIREYRMFRFRSLMGSLLGVFFAGLMMFCGTELWKEYAAYRTNSRNLPDFQYYSTSEYKEEGSYIWKSGGSEGRKRYAYGDMWVTNGFSDQFWSLLEELPGVLSFSRGTKDNSHLFEWENMQEDPYIVNLRNVEVSRGIYLDEDGNRVSYKDTMGDVVPENSLYFGYTSWFPENGKQIFALYYEAWGNEWMEEDAFMAGSQVFLICNEAGLLIQPGDSLWIVAGEEKIEVQVAVVIPQVEALEEHYPTTELGDLAMDAAMTNVREGDGGVSRNLYLVGSEQLARRIAEAEGAEFHYNWVDIWVNSFANYELSIKQCVRLLASEGAQGRLYYDFLQEELKGLLNKVITYGTFFVLLTTFFLILRANIIQSGFTFQGDRMKRLRLLGMEMRQLRNMNLLQGLYEARWSWLAIPVVYGVKLYQLCKNYWDSEEGSWSVFLEGTGIMTSDIGEILRYCWDDQMNLWVCLVVLVFVVLLHVLTRYLVSRSAIAALDDAERKK